MAEKELNAADVALSLEHRLMTIVGKRLEAMAKIVTPGPTCGTCIHYHASPRYNNSGRCQEQQSAFAFAREHRYVGYTHPACYFYERKVGAETAIGGADESEEK